MNHIDPHALYTRDELLTLIGDANVKRLRAIGDRYVGQFVLDVLTQAEHHALNQSASGTPKGGHPPDAHNTMEESRQRPHDTDHHMATHPRPNGVRGQIAEVEGTTAA